MSEDCITDAEMWRAWDTAMFEQVCAQERARGRWQGIGLTLLAAVGALVLKAVLAGTRLW